MGGDFKINFAIVGVQKAGTSALHQMLSQHPNLKFGVRKELHYFDNDNYFSGYRELNNDELKKMYKFNSFSFCKRLYGDSTPIYIFSETYLKRIFNHNKDIKLIIILRNPIKRAYSHWNMEVSRNVEKNEFGFCIRNEESRLIDDFSIRNFSYKKRGLYSEQILNLLSIFPQKNCFFIEYDEFRVNHQLVLDRIFKILGVKNKIIENRKIFSIEHKNSMLKEDKDYLINFFLTDIKKTEQILNWNLSHWLV